MAVRVCISLPLIVALHKLRACITSSHDPLCTLLAMDAGSNAGFWRHEFDKHGTCAKPVLLTQQEYFETTLELHAKYDIEVCACPPCLCHYLLTLFTFRCPARTASIIGFSRTAASACRRRWALLASTQQRAGLCPPLRWWGPSPAPGGCSPSWTATIGGRVAWWCSLLCEGVAAALAKMGHGGCRPQVPN